MVADESWAHVARDTREALHWLHYPIEPKCHPDEAEPCGGTFALHAMANLAVIKAIADHQLEHLGPKFTEAADEIYRYRRAELTRLDAQAGELFHE